MLNLTPHAITIIDDKTGKSLTIPPSGTVARVEQEYVGVGTIPVEGMPIPVVRTTFGGITGVPDDPNIPIIVSGMVLAALKGQPNVFAPDTGAGAVRDENGRIVAVTRLIAA